MTEPRRRGDNLWIDSASGFVAGAWFWPDRAEAASTVVLIVPGIVHEERTMAGGVVALAEALADNGLPALLIDLHGSGQSAGQLDDPDIGEHWRTGIRAALAHARSSGASRVIVVGVRLGFLLAAEALAGEALAALIAWAPVAHGKSHVRELKLLQRATGVETADPAAIAIGGFSIPACVQNHIASLDLAAIERLQTPIVLLRDSVDKLHAPWLARLKEQGHTVQEQASGQITPWLFSAADQPELPDEDIDALARWCRALHERTRGDGDAVPKHPKPRQQIDFIHRGKPIRETFVEIGRCGLTGVISEPVGEAGRHPVRLLTSTVGPGRTFADFARDEASRGRTCLRFDFAGYGTSGRGNSPPGGELYTDQGAGDVDAAITFLRLIGFEDIYGLGFCAGAWSMLQAGNSSALRAAVAINVALYRQPGPAAHAFFDRLRRHFQRHVSASTINSLASKVTLGIVGEFEGQSRPVKWLMGLCDADVAVLLTYADRDPGLDYITHCFTDALCEHSEQPFQLRTYEGLGHLAEGPDARARMFRDIGEYFAGLDAAKRDISSARV